MYAKRNFQMYNFFLIAFLKKVTIFSVFLDASSGAQPEIFLGRKGFREIRALW